jgi:hypothetical protein
MRHILKWYVKLLAVKPQTNVLLTTRQPKRKTQRKGKQCMSLMYESLERMYPLSQAPICPDHCSLSATRIFGTPRCIHSEGDTRSSVSKLAKRRSFSSENAHTPGSGVGIAMIARSSLPAWGCQWRSCASASILRIMLCTK